MAAQEQDLAGRTALVTGSTSGIGEAAARMLAAHGAHVIVAGRNRERGEAVVAAIRADGGKADFVQADLHDAASAQELARRAEQAAGGRIDVLVNNAGGGDFGPTQDLTEERFDQLVATNLKAPFFLVGALAPAMAERGAGSIVNVTTMAAQLGLPGMAAYGASKAALNLATKSWAAEFGPHGVRVNAVSPGPTRTPGVALMGDSLDQLAATSPSGFVASPDQIASVITFLAGDGAAYVQGAVVNVDGGRTAV
jgi:NAD(P)-dependent dehydrogenase (short-subunit alcohol dehydrogenase family)